MPLDEELRDQLKSPIADLKHTGSRYGGSITAALFLREFVGKSRWVHLDIAGPAYLPGRARHPPQGRHRLRRADRDRVPEGAAPTKPKA